MEVVVVGAKRYSFVNRETGEKVEGMTIHYLPEEIENSENSKGYVPLKMSTKLENWTDVKQVPGLYKLELGFSPDNRGNVKVKLNGLNFVKPVNIA